MIGRRPSRRRVGCAGFTLVETLVAVSLIGLVSLLLIEAARFASSGYERRLDISDAARARVEGYARLRDLFESATPAVYKTEEGKLLSYFDGDGSSLRFVAPYALLGAGARPGLALIELALAPAESPDRLVALHQPFALGGEPAPPQALTMIEGVGAIRSDYFDPGADPSDPFYLEFDLESADGDPVWRATWKGHSTQPGLVRLRLADVKGKEWPALVAAPRARRPAE